MLGCTVVIDGAAVMARVANVSVSRDIHVPDERWMKCIGHNRNNVMKSSMASYKDSLILQAVFQYFRVMKKIIEDENRCGWNHLLRRGLKLIQESGTRFGTYFLVFEQLFKASHHILDMLNPFGWCGANSVQYSRENNKY